MIRTKLINPPSKHRGSVHKRSTTKRRTAGRKQGAHTVAKKKVSKRKNPSSYPASVLQALLGKKQKSKPGKSGGSVRKKKNRGKGRHKNPPAAVRGAIGNLTQPVQWLFGGLEVILGLFVTRQLPQWLLKDKNSGILGYFANATAGGLASLAAGAVAGPRDAFLVSAGSAAYIVNRIVNENIAPIGEVLSLSGVGDFQAFGTGNSLAASLKGLDNAYWPLPVVYDSEGKAVLPAAFYDEGKRAARDEIASMGLTAPATVSGMRRLGRIRG